MTPTIGAAGKERRAFVDPSRRWVMNGCLGDVGARSRTPAAARTPVSGGHDLDPARANSRCHSTRLARLASIAASLFIGLMLLLPNASVLEPCAKAEGSPSVTTLRIGLLGSISTLNPLAAYTDNDLLFSSLIYDGLTAVDQDLNFTPNLARSWYAVPGTDPELIATGEPYGSVWQYNLTTQAYWHDGEPFTAEDVNYSLNVLAANWVNIWAYQPYTRYISHSEASGNEVRVHFRDPSTLASIPVAFGGSLPIEILPKHVIEKFTPIQLGFSWNGTPIVGTGPFMARSSTYQEFIEGRNITLLRNPNYHWTSDYGKQVKFDRVDLRFFEDEAALRTAIEARQVDVAKLNYSDYSDIDAGITSGTYPDLAAMDGLRADGYFTALAFSPQAWAGGSLAKRDPIVRMAMASLTNRSWVIDEVYGGHAANDSSLVSPLYPFWSYQIEPEPYPYDPASALLLLNLFGYEDLDGDGYLDVGPDSLACLMGWEAEGNDLTIDLMARSDIPEDLRIVQDLRASIESIGVHTTLRVEDPMSFVVALYKYTYDIAIDHVEQDPDPHRILFVESSAAIAGWSDNAYSSPGYDENFTGSISALDDHTRQTFVQNCQMYNAIDLGYHVIAYPNQTYVVRTDTFGGWGDWAAHPGRGLDAKWGANPLFFDLDPLAPDQAPTAAFTVTPEAGDIATLFVFNASGSLDADDPPSSLEVRWDWDGDGVWDTGWTTEKTAEHSYASPGNMTVQLIVRDGAGLTNSTTRDLAVTLAPIPEFGGLLVPLIASVLVMLVVIKRRSRKNAGPHRGT